MAFFFHIMVFSSFLYIIQAGLLSCFRICLYIALIVVHIVEIIKNKLPKQTIYLLYFSSGIELLCIIVCLYSLWKNYKLYVFQKETEYVPLESYDI